MIKTKYDFQTKILRIGYFKSGLLYRVITDVLNFVKNQI